MPKEKRNMFECSHSTGVFTSGLHTSSIRQLKVRSSANDPSPEGASQIRKANLNLQQQIQLPGSDRWWSRAFNRQLFKIRIGPIRWGSIRKGLYESLNSRFKDYNLPKNSQGLIRSCINKNKIKKVSVVITTRNRLSALKDYSLKSLSMLDFKKADHEVIIVDNASTDGTYEFLKKFKTSFNIKNLTIVKEDKIGASAGRNKGISVSTGDIIAFLDDDCYVDKWWLDRIFTIHKKNPVVLVQGYMYLGKTDIIQNTYFKSTIERRYIEANLSFKRGIFDYVSFNENMPYGCEGWDLISQIELLWPDFPRAFDKTPIRHYLAESEYRAAGNYKHTKKGIKQQKKMEGLWYINKHILRRNLNIDSNYYLLSFLFKELLLSPIELLFISFDVVLLFRTKKYIFNQLMRMRYLRLKKDDFYESNSYIKKI